MNATWPNLVFINTCNDADRPLVIGGDNMLARILKREYQRAPVR